MINKYQNILTHALLNNCKSHSLTFPPVTLSKIEKSDGIDKDVGACVPVMMGVHLCIGEQFGNICQNPFTLPVSCDTQQSLLLEISCSGMLAHIWRDTRLRILMCAAPVSRPTLACPTVLEHCPHPLPCPPRSSLPRPPPPPCVASQPPLATVVLTCVRAVLIGPAVAPGTCLAWENGGGFQVRFREEAILPLQAHD